MSRQQYINKNLTKLLKKVETAIRQGEYEGAVTPADNLKVPCLIFKILFIEDEFGIKKSGKSKPSGKESAEGNQSVGESDNA